MYLNVNMMLILDTYLAHFAEKHFVIFSTRFWVHVTITFSTRSAGQIINRLKNFGKGSDLLLEALNI
jgi:hypothetical protein